MGRGYKKGDDGEIPLGSWSSSGFSGSVRLSPGCRHPGCSVHGVDFPPGVSGECANRRIGLSIPSALFLSRTLSRHSTSSPEVFAHSPRPPMNFFIDHGSSHRVSLPFNVSPDVPTQPSKEVQVALLRFLPLRRICSPGAHYPRACLTRYVAPSGFLNLLTLSFSRSRPALFHAGNALGVTPSRAFPPLSAAPLTHRQRIFPLAVHPKIPEEILEARLQGIEPRAGPLLRFGIFQPQRSPMLSWAFVPSRVLPFSSGSSRSFRYRPSFLSWTWNQVTRSLTRPRPSESCRGRSWR
jgi:hypothetical protein